jgi:elongation factor 1-beta
MLMMTRFRYQTLRITLVIEDDKISLEELQERIEAFEEYVQGTNYAVY